MGGNIEDLCYKKGKWKSAGACTVGKSHIKKNIPCQDKIYSIIGENTNVIALSDGAGSCRYSHYGAEITTKVSCILLKKNFSKLYNRSEKEIASIFLRNIIKNLNKFALKFDTSTREFSSTLLFVGIRNGKYICGHIGDGVIGILNDNVLEVLSEPDNGEYANSTYFVTSQKVFEHFRIYKGNIDRNTKGFLLMSDGSAESLYDKRNKALAPATKQFLEWLSTNPPEDIDKALEMNLDKVISKRTTDDCSINLLTISKDTQSSNILDRILILTKKILRLS